MKHRFEQHEQRIGATAAAIWRRVQHPAMDAGYCIDAPEFMPAGCMWGVEFSDGTVNPFPSIRRRGVDQLRERYK